jgi:hypothetical protein
VNMNMNKLFSKVDKNVPPMKTELGSKKSFSFRFFYSLKVPKREIFSIAFFAQSEPNWICDVGTSKKIEFFYQLTPDFDGFWFFAAYW